MSVLLKVDFFLTKMTKRKYHFHNFFSVKFYAFYLYFLACSAEALCNRDKSAKLGRCFSLGRRERHIATAEERQSSERKRKKRGARGSRVVRQEAISKGAREIERLRSIARRLARDAEKFLTVAFLPVSPPVTRRRASARHRAQKNEDIWATREYSHSYP